MMNGNECGLQSITYIRRRWSDGMMMMVRYCIVCVLLFRVIRVFVSQPSHVRELHVLIKIKDYVLSNGFLFYF